MNPINLIMHFTAECGVDKTGIIASELQSLATGGAISAASGGHFDVKQALVDNLGSAVGNAVVDAGMNLEYCAVNDTTEEYGYKPSLFEKLFLQEQYETTLARQKAALEAVAEKKEAEQNLEHEAKNSLTANLSTQ